MRLRTVVYAAVALGLAPAPASAMGFGNTVPVVDAVTVNPSPAAANATATITCAAHDADGQVVKLTVSVTGGTLASSGAASADIAVAPGASVTADVQWQTPPTG